MTYNSKTYNTISLIISICFCTFKINLLKHFGQGPISSGVSICFVNLKVIHQEDIMSHSLCSLTLYFPIYSIPVLLVAKNGIVFERSMHMSVANWFFGLGRWTVYHSKSKKKSAQAIISVDHLESFK